MSIKFSCPHCKKTLKVKDELAGRKGLCPVCKKLVQIPVQTVYTPSSSGSNIMDIEALAASTLAEQKEEVAGPGTIDLTCPYCDENVKFPANLGGKQSPCPACKRIVKVPLPVRTGPRDWRKPDEDRLPSGAKRADATPEGAWGTEAVRGVSRAALIEAAVIKEEKEPFTIKQWTLYGTAIVVVLGAITWGTLAWFGRSKEKLEGSALAIAESFLKEGKGDAATQAELQRVLGIYHELAKQDAADSSGRQRLQQARLAAEKVADPAERMAVIRELLLTQVDLGIAVEEMGAVLALAPAGEFRECVVREMARRALAKGSDVEAQASRIRLAITQGVAPVTRQTAGATAKKDGGAELDASEQNACLAILYQELVHAGKSDMALPLAEKLRAEHKPKALFPQQLNALLILLNKPELEAPKEQEEAQLASRAEGYARAGALAKANDTLQLPQFGTPTLARMDTLLAVADALVDRDQKPRALELLNDAQSIMERFRDETAWQRQRLVELLLAAGNVAEVERQVILWSTPTPTATNAALLAGPALDRARLAILRAKLAAQNPEPTLMTGFNLKTSGHGVAAFELARAMAASDAKGALKWAEGLDENIKPFAAAGVAAGMRSAK